MKHYFKIFACMVMGISILACNQNEEKMIDNGHGNGKDGGFSIGAVSQFETKAAEGTTRRVQTDRIALSEPGDPEQLYLIETVEDMDDSYYQTEIETKGTPVYTETFNYSEFSTVALKSDGTKYSTSNNKSVKQDGLIYKYAAFGEHWPTDADEEMMFFFGAPADLETTKSETLGYDNLTIDKSGKIKFDYVSPSAAAYQQDLLFSSRKITKEQYAQTAKILFYHTLAGVKFKSGNAMREGTKTANGKTVANMTNITKITFTNILSNGHCEVVPDCDDYNNTNSNATPSVPKSSSVTTWTWPEGMTKEYAEYSIDVDHLSSNTNQFDETTAFEGGKALGQLNMNGDNFENTFMFIPQTTGTDVVLTIEYTLNGNKYRKSVNFGTRTWEAGKLYTYTVEANHVGVVVADHLDDGQHENESNTKKIKTFEYIQNTGNVDEYMRVAIIGNWYDSHSFKTTGQDQIVYPWSGIDKSKTGYVTNSVEGSFSGAEFAPAPWIDGGDGYWYYPYKVEPGTNVDIPLFGKFTAGTCPMGLYASDAHLELEIIVQAIDASWNDGATKQTAMVGYGWKMDLFKDSTYENRQK